MSDQPITVRLSRADAVALRELFDPRLAWTQIDHQHTLIRNLRNAIKTALAAPAEGPERAATGETITDEMVTRCAIALMDSGVYECGIDGARDAARTVLAAIGGGGE